MGQNPIIRLIKPSFISVLLAVPSIPSFDFFSFSPPMPRGEKQTQLIFFPAALNVKNVEDRTKREGKAKKDNGKKGHMINFITKLSTKSKIFFDGTSL
jgi:hypothetical protein